MPLQVRTLNSRITSIRGDLAAIDTLSRQVERKMGLMHFPFEASAFAILDKLQQDTQAIVASFPPQQPTQGASEAAYTPRPTRARRAK
jgi:hypothetical protein